MIKIIAVGFIVLPVTSCIFEFSSYESQKYSIPNESYYKNSMSFNRSPTTSNEDTGYSKIENDWVCINEDKEDYVIKKGAYYPTYISNNGSSLLASDLNNSSFENFKKHQYVLMPEKHWLIESLNDNPFPRNIRTNLTLWSVPLLEVKRDKETILFKKQNPSFASLSELSDTEYFDLVGNSPLKELGRGANGIIWEFFYQGKPYAIKENAKEYKILEQLQFTGAVVKTYGYFLYKNKTYLIMDKGEYSLSNAPKLPEKQLIEAAHRFSQLIDIENKLGIVNNDINPNNIIVMADQSLKVIDPSPGYQEYYAGDKGEKFTRSLLESHLQKKLFGGNVPLWKYFQYNKKYSDFNIASAAALSYWNMLVCEKETLLEDCQNITDYNQLYPLFSREKLYEFISSDPNNSLKDEYYHTKVSLPNILPKDKVQWQIYWSKKDILSEQFCKQIGEFNDMQQLDEIKDNYLPFCKKDGDNWSFSKNFSDANDPVFQQFIEDIFYPLVKRDVFIALAQKYRFTSIIPFIIEKKTVTPLKEALLLLLSKK